MNKKLSLVATAVVLTSASASANIDARSFAMGGTGVSNANYLTSSFHNPALAARYSREDDFGMLLPTLNLRVHDGGDIAGDLETFDDAFSQWEDSNGTDSQAEKQWKEALEAMDGDYLTTDVNAGMVIAIPNRILSANLFAQTNVTVLGTPMVADSDLAMTDPNADLESSVIGVSGGTVDIGLTLARELEVDALPGRLYLGVSPKFQQLVSLGYNVGVEDADDDELSFDDANTSAGFNLDIGLAYDISKNWQLGLSARNLLEQKLETNTLTDFGNATYVVGPEFTIGGSYQHHLFALSADIDLNERQYFEEFDYATQYARFGAEFDAWSWAQIRAGYALSMTDHAEDMITAGLGFKLFGSAGFDLSAGYSSDNNYGVAMQLIMEL